MPLLIARKRAESIATDEPSWPADARAMMFMFEAFCDTHYPPRPVDRAKCYARLAFLAESNDVLADDCILYARDVGYQTISFIGQHVMIPGQRGHIEVPLQSGKTKRLHAIVRRCRPFTNGWFEGIVHCRSSQPLRRKQWDVSLQV